MSQFQSDVRYRGSLVSITDIRCRPSACGLSGEEYASVHEVVFPRAGVFVKHVGHRRAVADPNHVLFFNAGEPYSVSHPVPGGDDCTCFVFSDETLMDVLCSYDRAARDHPERPFLLSHCLVEPQTIIRQQRLRQRLSDHAASDLEIEESALGLLQKIVRDAYRRQEVLPQRQRPGTQRLRRDWVEAVKLFMAERPEANLSLSEIARAVHCSPFHLARLFRAAVGSTIHQYQLRLRLALALERLSDHPASLTNLALDLGFSSHSHFTAAFQRLFGTSPSKFRRTITGPRL
ncbi:MAG TPA: AraC family transcriptional regulator [Pyrinomonadaceae bacterium]|nr:AraC family transcriptional regulator [Pyrinomonadaceae bacterium]